MSEVPAGSKLLISSPAEIDAFVRELPPGKFVNTKHIRDALATRHEADATCPLTTGIFLRIVTECALEQLEAGMPTQEVTPFWRAIDPKSPLARKVSCGTEKIRTLRAAETAQ